MTSETKNESKTGKWVTLTVLLVSTLTVMATATITPAVPEMELYFQNIPNIQLFIRLTLSIPALAIAIGSPLVGVIIDKWGRKKPLLGAAFLYGLAGSSGFYLNSLNLIFLSRIFLGLAVAGIMTISTTLVFDYFQGRRRDTMLGYQAAFMGFGGVIFFSFGGYLASINWHAPFVIYIFAWVLIPGLLMLPEPKFMKNSSVIQPDQYSIVSKENRIPYSNIVFVYFLVFIFQIVFFFSIAELPFLLTNKLLLNPDLVGIVLATLTLSMGIFSILYGRLSKRISLTNIFILAFTFFGTGYFIISLALTRLEMILGLSIAGVGLGLLIPNLSRQLGKGISQSIRGRVFSGFTSFLFLGQFLSPLVSQILLQFISLTELFLIGGTAMILVALLILMKHYLIPPHKEELDAKSIV
ncbi:MFS transporter [Candidatus Heimdallarchaeota archaeon B3_Heim]|nr:MAG: MFS transporter [Candidatus Heimdallarchaeota archaeon B3_Heim]